MKRDEKLALFGGIPAVGSNMDPLFKWPIITEEDEAAVLQVLREGNMSGIDVTRKFEQEFARWQGVEFALGFHNGTASLQAAMYGCGVGVGDEVICPSMTYWASALPAFSLGATIVFADIDPVSLCIDPTDIEHRITERTKAIMVVHYLGHPAEMDAIMDIAHKHGIKVIEDVSHAQGGMYKGRKLGSIGHVGAMSLMSGKAFAIGEAGILVTNEREILEKAIALGHYERMGDQVTSPALKAYEGLPLGGYKYRMHQLSSAVGRVQLKYYDQRVGEIDKAMNYFWSRLEGVAGIRPHRPDYGLGHRVGGWYGAHGFYLKEELGGLSIHRFCEALRAEGVTDAYPGSNLPLHLHPVFNDADIYGHGKPTRIAHTTRDVRQPRGSLPITEQIGSRIFWIPWFKHYQPDLIEQYVSAFIKVTSQSKLLLDEEMETSTETGQWNFFKQNKDKQ